jgi:hypothetical protein
MESNLVTKKEPVGKDPWDDDEHDETAVTHVGTSDRDGMVVTLKAGSGYNAPWLVLHAVSVADATSQMQADSWDELADLTARKNKEFEKLFGGLLQAAQKASGGGGGGWSKPKASASSDRPEDTCPAHNCDLEFVAEFTNPRTQKTTSARMACPVPKCYKKTYWLNDDGTWSLKEQ